MTHPARTATASRIPWLSRAARARPDHPALITGERTYSYRELEDIAAVRAGQLLRTGLEPGRRLAIWMSNEAAFVESMHAAARLGCPLVVLNARLTAREVTPLLEQSNPMLLLHADALAAPAADATSSSGVPAISVRELSELVPASAGEVEPARERLDDEHTLLFTSGTTGIPKGVRIGLRQHEASARATAERLGAGTDDRWLLCMPVYHIGGLAILLRAALHATSVVLHERFDIDRVVAALIRDRVTHVSLVPTMLARLLEHTALRELPATLRCVLLGGGPIAPQIAERALALGWPLCGTYGMTETASGIATSHPGDSDLLWLSPLADTEIRIVDPEGHSLPSGHAGEICVRGPQIMSGYLGARAKTEEKLRDGWLHTGDMGELDARGRVRILDRRTDLIVSGGENIYPAEVEAVLAQHPRIHEVAVVGARDLHWGHRPVAIVVERAAEEPSMCTLEEELLALCERELAGYKRPRAIVRWAGSLPRTASGKLRRDVLREWLHERASA